MKDPNVNTTYTGLLHKYQPSAEHHPCYSGLQVQGAATTPAARYFNYTCYICLLSRCVALNRERLTKTYYLHCFSLISGFFSLLHVILSLFRPTHSAYYSACVGLSPALLLFNDTLTPPKTYYLYFICLISRFFSLLHVILS